MARDLIAEHGRMGKEVVVAITGALQITNLEAVHSAITGAGPRTSASARTGAMACAVAGTMALAVARQVMASGPGNLTDAQGSLTALRHEYRRSKRRWRLAGSLISSADPKSPRAAAATSSGGSGKSRHDDPDSKVERAERNRERERRTAS